MNGLFVAVLVACCIIEPSLFIALAGIMLAGIMLTAGGR